MNWKTKIYVYIIWFLKKTRKFHKIVVLHLKNILNNIKYTFEVIKYFLYIYIFLDEKYKFVYNVISLKIIYTDNLDIRKRNIISFKT